MNTKNFIFAAAILLFISIFSSGCGDSTTNWCTGNWEGRTNNKPEYFTIKINSDGTCKVLQQWRGLEDWYEEFDGEWEKVSDNVIKIYDYNGHMHINVDSRRPNRSYRVSRWSMHLRDDGAFDPQIDRLDNPTARLSKK